MRFETEDLEYVMHLMKTFHVRHLVYNGLDIKMSSSAFEYPELLISKKEDPTHPKDPLEHPMTPEQILFWSSGGAEYTDRQGNEVPVPLTGEEHE